MVTFLSKEDVKACNAALQDSPGASTAHPAHYLSEPHLYSSNTQTIVSYTGHEVAHPDYNGAVAFLNRLMALKMDAVDERLVGLLLRGLHDTPRFGGDPSMPARLGENSAAHSCQSTVLLKDVFDAAQLRTQANDTSFTPLFQPDGSTAYPEIIPLRQVAGLATLVHDCGEMLGEFNTVYQRSSENAAVSNESHNKALLEREIYKFSVSLAMLAIERGTPELFLTRIHQLREELQIQREGVPQGDAVPVEHIASIIHASDTFRELSDSGQAKVREWLEIWDIGEFKGEADIAALENDPAFAYTPRVKDVNIPFLGNLVKSNEHNQGSRHLLHFAADDIHRLGLVMEHTPLGFSDAGIRAKMFDYNEKELPLLYRTAQTPVEYALADANTARVYETMLDCTKRIPVLSQPIDRSSLKPAADARIQELATAFPDDAASLASRAELTMKAGLASLYERAINLAKQGIIVPAEGGSLVTRYLQRGAGAPPLPASLTPRPMLVVTAAGAELLPEPLQQDHAYGIAG